MMPGMDGFEVARHLKADFATQHIPIIFMTGLTETEHVVAAFAPAAPTTSPSRSARPRCWPHRRPRAERPPDAQARSALDAFGQATVAVRAADSRIVWQTPLARSLLMPSSPPRDRGPVPATGLDRRRLTPPAATAATRPALLVADGPGACSPPSTTRPATTVAGRPARGERHLGRRIPDRRLPPHPARGRGALLGRPGQDQQGHRRHPGQQPAHREQTPRARLREARRGNRTAAANLAMGRMRGS